MGVVAFSHLAVVARDLDTQVGFYSSALEFRPGRPYASRGKRVASLMEAEPSGFRGIFLVSGGFLLEFLEYVEGEEAPLPRVATEPGLAHISVVVDDVHTTVAQVEQHGGTLWNLLEHSFDGGEGVTRIAFCLDPEGNRVELISHHGAGEAGSHARFLGLPPDVTWPAGHEPKPRARHA